MQFKGQLLLPDESGPGLNVSLDVAEHHLAVESEGGGLGAWPLEAVEVRRVHGDTFSLNVAGETLQFVAEDTVAFAYAGVQAIERLAGKPKSPSTIRSLLGRIWNGPAQAGDAAQARTSPADDPGRKNASVEAEDLSSHPTETDEFESKQAVNLEPSTVHEGAKHPEPLETISRFESETLMPTTAAPANASCRAVRSDGRPCESQILNDAGYCYPHDPKRSFEDGYKMAQEARAQLRREGTARLNRIYSRLDKAMRQVERGDLDPETAMAMAQLARTMCAILDLDEPPSAENPAK